MPLGQVPEVKDQYINTTTVNRPMLIQSELGPLCSKVIVSVSMKLKLSYTENSFYSRNE